jgi:formate dehydrogenase subunit delta
VTAEIMVHMANQIAQFFASYPHEEAVAGVANHLHKFSEKRMRQQLHEYVAHGGGGLSPLVLEAEKRLASVATQK